MGAGAVDDDQLIGAWAKQYHLPTENDKRALTDRKHLYRPPKSDAGGIAVALAVIGCWAALFIHGLWFIKLPFNVASGEKPSSWLHIAAVFFSLEFLYTGLFITTHDAMHGTIALRNRRLNGERPGRVVQQPSRTPGAGLTHGRCGRAPQPTSIGPPATCVSYWRVVLLECNPYVSCPASQTSWAGSQSASTHGLTTVSKQLSSASPATIT